MTVDNRERKNKSASSGKLISLIVVLLFLLPAELTGWLIALALFLAPVGAIVWYALKNTAKGTKKEEPFDDCPKPICFHKDKGEHHVKRGREIDPWDRPDIDISKYQRR